MKLVWSPERVAMKDKILFISEALAEPFDEGIKNVTFSVQAQLKKSKEVLSITKAENIIHDQDIRKVNINKLFISNRLKRYIKQFSPRTILYLPESSLTFLSFLRAKVLKIMRGESKVVLLGIQHREYTLVQSYILEKLLKPDLLLLLGKSDEAFFKERGFNVKVLPPAVSTDTFSPPVAGEREKIRERFNIPEDKYVVLHIGHIKVNRNIECLKEIQKIDNMQVIIVGSTSIVIEKDIKKRLSDAGIIVIDEYIPDISMIYKMSDLYVFPVKNEREAIEMPLSVLEAMACNLPIITTTFQGLVEHFKEDECFRFFQDENELIGKVKEMIEVKSHNSKKMESFTWEAFSDAIINAVDELP
jgi:glycosyltransferase involved in cell wall biosynthesis